MVGRRKVCSQIRNTRQPARRNVRVTRTSRALLRANLFFQKARLTFGCAPCFGQPCQKQPSTNSASRTCLKIKSGRTFTPSPRRGAGRGGVLICTCRRQPVILCRRNNFASASSVSLFPRERMRDITNERFALVKMSDIYILKSVDLPTLAVKAQPGHGNISDHWSCEEVEATVSDYFEMLAMELRDEPFNKAEHNRNLQKFLNNRTKGAVELKHQNISAVLIELGYPYIDGYKPRYNF